MTLYRKVKDKDFTWLIYNSKTADGKVVHIFQYDNEYLVVLNSTDFQVTGPQRELTKYRFQLLRHAKGFAKLLLDSSDGWADYHEYTMKCMDDDDKRYYAKRPAKLQYLRSLGMAPKWDV